MPTQAPQFAIGIGTLALVNAGLAQGRNRSGLAWFFGSLLLGPIATLLIVGLPMNPSADDQRGAKKAFNLQNFRR